jgi:methionyl-tRNA formyltransferase
MRKNLVVSVVVDNPSWILPFAKQLVIIANDLGHSASLANAYGEIGDGDVAFFLGCVSIASPSVLRQNRLNLVVHESELPKGRGFAPVAWQILEGHNNIPVVLFEATDGVDSGPIFLREEIQLTGYELNEEIRMLQGDATVRLCENFLKAYPGIEPVQQQGESSRYRRRMPIDSKLDPDKSLRGQFNLLRIVDNKNYPAFFELDGHRYIVKIFPSKPQE